MIYTQILSLPNTHTHTHRARDICITEPIKGYIHQLVCESASVYTFASAISTRVQLMLTLACLRNWRTTLPQVTVGSTSLAT